MSIDIEEGINVEISGGRQVGKTAVAHVIHGALKDAGFTNVSMSDQIGKKVEPLGENESIADLIAKNHPQLLATPVAILETTNNDGLDAGLDDAQDELLDEDLVGEGVLIAQD